MATIEAVTTSKTKTRDSTSGAATFTTKHDNTDKERDYRDFRE
jgi:hypothetical protein